MSKLWTLTKNDYIKGLVVAIIAGVLTAILEALQTGTAIDLSNIINVALIAGLSYLLKNLGTDENGRIGGKL